MAIQTNSLNYQDSTKFDPTRWQTDEKESFAYIPFGGGKRNCIG